MTSAIYIELHVHTATAQVLEILAIFQNYPVDILKMEFPDLGKNCHESTCKQLGEFCVKISFYMCEIKGKEKAAVSVNCLMMLLSLFTNFGVWD